MPIGIYKRKSLIKAGDKYNRLTAIKFNHKNKWNGQYWLFKCDCGNEKVIYVSSVKRGNTKSCGCLQIENGKKSRTHGMSNTKEYHTWASMNARCYNSNNPKYKIYGAREIKVCNRWKNSFENFYEDMGKKPRNKSLDRIDNNGNYCKKNCRWTTPMQQQNNTRYNIFVSVNGAQVPFSELAEMFGIKRNTLYSRLFTHNWTLKKALIKK